MGILLSMFKELRNRFGFPEKLNVGIGYQRVDEDKISQFILEHFLRDDQLTLEGANMKLTVSKDGKKIEIPLKIVYPLQSGENLKGLVGDQIYAEHKFMHVTFSVREDKSSDEKTTNRIEISGFKRRHDERGINATPSVDILSFNWLDEVKKYKSIVIHSTSGCNTICDVVRNSIPNTIKVLKDKVEIERINKSSKATCGLGEAKPEGTGITPNFNEDMSDAMEQTAVEMERINNSSEATCGVGEAKPEGTGITPNFNEDMSDAMEQTAVEIERINNSSEATCGVGEATPEGTGIKSNLNEDMPDNSEPTAVEIERINYSSKATYSVGEATPEGTGITANFNEVLSDVSEQTARVDESSFEFVDTLSVSGETNADIDTGAGTIDDPDTCLNVVVTLKRTRIQSDAESAIEQTMLTEEMKKKTMLLIFHKIIGSKTVEDVSSIMYRHKDVLKTFNVPYRIKE